jgi:PhnB protein
MATELKPYLFIYGRCEEALEFYKRVFGGSYEAIRVGDTPVASEMPPGSEKNIMHASFTAEGIAFFASDGQANKTVDPDAGNISLALSFEDGARGEQIFNALGEGGNVSMPIGPAFWGGRFGIVVDKFGTEWMTTLP